MVRPVETRALPSFLRQTTYLSPKGNATAEVLSELNRRSQTAGREGAIGRADRSARAKVYFTEELHNRLEFYEIAGSRLHYQHRLFQVVTLMCALAILVILYGELSNFGLSRLFSTLFVAVIILVVVLGTLGNHQVKAFQYRLTAKRMDRERRKYVNFTVPYTVGLGENRAYELFVENVEQVLQDEGG